MQRRFMPDDSWRVAHDFVLLSGIPAVRVRGYRVDRAAFLGALWQIVEYFELTDIDTVLPLFVSGPEAAACPI